MLTNRRCLFSSFKLPPTPIPRVCSRMIVVIELFQVSVSDQLRKHIAASGLPVHPGCSPGDLVVDS